MTTLPLDFDIFLRSGSSTQPEMAACAHGSVRCSRCDAEHRGEKPRADDVVRLRTHVHREHTREQIRIVEPPARDLRCHRRGGPRVHDVRVARRTRRACRADRPCNRQGRRSTDRSEDATRPAGAGGRSRRCRRPSPRYHTGNGTPKNRCRLTHQSPASPFTQFSYRWRMYSGCHFSSRPRSSSSSPELHRLDEPLAAGDDLERAVALLEELHRVRDRARLADHVAGLAQQLDDLRARLGGREVREADRRPAAPSPDPRDSQPGVPHATGAERTVRLDDGAHRQRQLAPPGHVREVAEGADHRDAAALRRIGQRVRLDRNRHAEERRLDRRCRRAACSARRRDARRAPRTPGSARAGSSRSRHDAATGLREPDAVVRAGLLAILQLCLRDGRAEVHVPQRGRLELIGDAALQQPQEGGLRHPLRTPVDRRVGLATSPPTTRGGATGARTPSRLRPSAGCTAR